MRTSTAVPLAMLAACTTNVLPSTPHHGSDHGPLPSPYRGQDVSVLVIRSNVADNTVGDECTDAQVQANMASSDENSVWSLYQHSSQGRFDVRSDVVTVDAPDLTFGNTLSLIHI